MGDGTCNSKTDGGCAVTTGEVPNGPPAGLKPCCACPETRKPRDDCIVGKGEENCKDLIEAHKSCMRKLGFKV